MRSFMFVRAYEQREQWECRTQLDARKSGIELLSLRNVWERRTQVGELWLNRETPVGHRNIEHWKKIKQLFYVRKKLSLWSWKTTLKYERNWNVKAWKIPSTITTFRWNNLPTFQLTLWHDVPKQKLSFLQLFSLVLKCLFNPFISHPFLTSHFNFRQCSMQHSIGRWKMN